MGTRHLSTSSHIIHPARTRRRLSRFLRPVSPAAVAVTVSLLFGGAGFADAATGGTFILGRANHETSTASLSDSKGTPLALSAPHGKAPLAVNRKAMVKNLNAQYLGGTTASGLAVTGGEGISPVDANIPVNNTGEAIVAHTGNLPPGNYYATATALVDLQVGDGFGQCWIGTSFSPNNKLDVGEMTPGAGEASVAETAVVGLTTPGHQLEEICVTDGANGSLVINAGIIAIRVRSSHS